MHRRLTARVLLACYGVIALAGQGLHEFLDDDGCDQAGQSVSAVVAAAQYGGQTQEAEQLLVVRPPGGHVHDCDNCPICQFQALGQHFVALPPADNGLARCNILSPSQVGSAHCAVLFSPAQPRAPPTVS